MINKNDNTTERYHNKSRAQKMLYFVSVFQKDDHTCVSESRIHSATEKCKKGQENGRSYSGLKCDNNKRTHCHLSHVYCITRLYNETEQQYTKINNSNK